MDIGIAIHNIRLNEYKENSRDFAKRCGISKSCLLQIERGVIIKPSKKTLTKIEKALNIDLNSISKTNGVHIYKKSQKEERFKNVFNSICRDIEKDISLLDCLCDEELYRRVDELLDKALDEIMNLIEEKRACIKAVDITTKEEKKMLLVEELFKNDEVEIFPPRKKEVK